MLLKLVLFHKMVDAPRFFVRAQPVHRYAAVGSETGEYDKREKSVCDILPTPNNAHGTEFFTENSADFVCVPKRALKSVRPRGIRPNVRRPVRTADSGTRFSSRARFFRIPCA